MKVYIASPIQTYTEPRYPDMVAQVGLAWPYDDMLPAKSMFASSAEWRSEWPKLVKTLGLLVFFTDKDGFIGKGVKTEIDDALKLKIPVYYLEENTFYPYNEVHIVLFDNGDDWRHYATVQTLPAAPKSTTWESQLTTTEFYELQSMIAENTLEEKTLYKYNDAIIVWRLDEEDFPLPGIVYKKAAGSHTFETLGVAHSPDEFRELIAE